MCDDPRSTAELLSICEDKLSSRIIEGNSFDEAKERARFQVWLDGHPLYALFGEHSGQIKDAMWKAWQARAYLDGM